LGSRIALYSLSHIRQALRSITYWQICVTIESCLNFWVAATTMTLPPNKADEFFKLWRRKDDSGKSWGDGQMLRVSERDQHHILEEMGFPSSHDEKGAWKPMGLYFSISSILSTAPDLTVFLIFSCPRLVPPLCSCE
jgi:hypothetical protein